MNYAQVKNNVVVNVVVFEEPIPADFPEAETYYHNEQAQIGWTFDGTNFIPPAKPATYSTELNMGGTIRQTITGG